VRSEPFLTLADVTAFFLSCLVPTLLFLSCFVPTLCFGRETAAYAPPPRATKRATTATIIAGDGR
jgi:hypothetical protein